ncbi:MAG: 4a-hydroxytetrahydrobiopterin dehydratase [Pseudomonadota bacterium]
MQLLNEKTCTACNADAPKATTAQIAEGLAELPEWKLVRINGEDQLTRSYKFKNFAAALVFTQAVGALAEEHNHHPTLLTEWGKVTVNWWTHKINGIHENDLIMAAKTEQLFAIMTA